MTVLRHISIVLLTLLMPLFLQAQDDWDTVLDRYESICGRCIELRERITAGEAVQSAEVTQLLGELNRLRTQIQASEGSMTSAQRRRFKEIRRRYDGSGNARQETGGKVSAVQRTSKKGLPEPIEDTTVVRSASVLPPGRMVTDKTNLLLDVPEGTGIVPQKIAQTSSSNHKEPARPLYGPIRADIIPLLELGLKPAYGLFASVAKEQWGGYLSVRSNFVGTGSDYVTDADGNIAGGGKFWGDGITRYGLIDVSGGAVWHALDAIGLYFGAAYGTRCLAWQDASGNWARVSDYSYTGFGFDAGAIVSLWHIDFLAGAGWLGGWSLVFGIGYSF